MTYGYFQDDSIAGLDFTRGIKLLDPTDLTLYLVRKYTISYEEIFNKGITIDRGCIAYLKPPDYRNGLDKIFLLPCPNDRVIDNNKNDGSTKYMYDAANYNSYLRNVVINNKDLLFTVYLYSFNVNQNDEYGLTINSKNYVVSSKNRIRFLELISVGLHNTLTLANSSSLYKNIEFAFELPIPCLFPDKWKYFNLPLIIQYVKNKDGSHRGTFVTRSIPRISINDLDERYTLPDDSSFNNFTTGITITSQMIIDVTGL